MERSGRRVVACESGDGDLFSSDIGAAVGFVCGEGVFSAMVRAGTRWS